MTKDEQDAKVSELGELAVKEAVALVNRIGLSEPRRVVIVAVFEEVGPDLWAHGSGVGHPSDVEVSPRKLLKTVLDRAVDPS